MPTMAGALARAKGQRPKQIERVTALPAADRFKHFVKVIADQKEVWGLYQDGWALAAADDGATVFPMWPAKEYAEICAVDEWSKYEPRSIPLQIFCGELLPRLRMDGVLPGVFFTPTGKGVTPSIEELEAALKAELENY